MVTFKRKFGDLGEKLASSFLEKKGHKVIAKNYHKYSGEIDIVSCENQNIHFIEVKTAFVPMNNVSREKMIRPEDHVTRSKIRKIERTALRFLDENNLLDSSWSVDVVAVYLFQRLREGSDVKNNKSKYSYFSKIVYLENVY